MRFKIYVNCDPDNNPAQSDVCGHIGGNGNHPCRKCLVGGPQQVKETVIGFHSLFEVCRFLSLLWLLTRLIQAGVSCLAEGILSDVKSQVELACLGIAQNVQNLQTKNGVKDGYTQFWIDELVARARTLRKNHSGRTVADIQT